MASHDDDLDDLLDNVLDDFNKPVPASSSAKAGAPGASDAALNDPELDDELAKQLAQGMEQLMANMGEHPELKEQMEALVQTFEKDMPAFAEAAGAAAAAKGKTKAESGDRSAEAFQEKIEETLNKLRNSQDKVGAEVMDGMMSDDMMAEMMKQMEGLVESGEFTTALEGMMEQLMAREVLYEPMKDLADKYPAWLESNKDQHPRETFAKYERQYAIVTEIVRIYEASETTSADDLKKVAELMQQMQETGNPPDDIVKELAPDMEFGPNGPKFPELGGKDCCVM